MPAPRTSENPVLLPYLSGVPSAGRSLDQRHLDLRLLAERGGEAELGSPGAELVLFTVRPDRWLTADFAEVDER